MEASNIIECHNIGKKYTKTNKDALSKIDLAIPKNQIMCLLGPNGAGKTTLIKILCNLLLPDSGQVEYDKLLKENNKISNISVVLEGARTLYWRVKVKSNFYYLGALKGKNRKFINDKIEKYDKYLNIKEFLNKKVNTLSLGQKQRIAIIAAILIEPKLLILDEPTNGLDIQSKNDLISLLNYIKETLNTTILIASHDVDFARKIVQSFVIIDNGEIKNILINDKLSNEIIEQNYLKLIMNN